MTKVKRIDGSELFIDTSIEPLKSHFENPYNYTKEIIGQFDEGFYNNWIKGSNLTILNLGGNVGLFDFHMMPKISHSYIVEPTPSHNAVKKVLLDGFPVTHIEVAVSDHTGTTPFFQCGINSTMNSIQDRFNGSIDLPCMTLEDIFNKYHLEEIDLMKVDIEGSEHTAITVDLLKPVADKIKTVWMEVHAPNTEEQEKFAKIFEAVGFSVEKIHNDCLYCTK